MYIDWNRHFNPAHLTLKVVPYVIYPMNKLRNILILIFISSQAYGQGFIEMDTIETPNELLVMFSGHSYRTIHVDFNGDGNKDYICQPDLRDNPIEPYQEIWIDSDFKKVKTIDKYLEDYNYFWFVNIDSDPEPEIFSATGYSDGIDYCFIDQDLETGKDSILFYFNPVILDNDKKYWGYPWDITDLIILNDKGLLKVRCSLDHEITRNGEITRPDWQSIFPVICFKGHSTQPNIKVGQINSMEWLEIIEICKRIK